MADVRVRTVTPLAMATAGLMLGHQVAAKAVRDAVFLSAWPAAALPAIVIATAVVAILAVPLYARLLGAFGPRTIVPAGFLLSAIAHTVEWQYAGVGRWGAVAVYLHVAAFGALLLSGFWSLVSEIFDPRSAKATYGTIAAAGTIGGLIGGLATARLASAASPNAPLLLLALLHAACAVAVFLLGRSPAGLAREPSVPAGGSSLLPFDALRHAPHLKTLALMVLLSTAAAAIVDFLLKAEASRPEHFGSRAELLQFFAVFYTVSQVVTVIAQTGVGATVRRLGLGRTISTLPAGLGITSGIALLYPTLSMFIVTRGIEAVLRGSMFRSGYELLFVPMDPADKRRTKTFMDVTCDRAGDALGAMVVWLLLLTNAEFQKAELLAVVIGLACGGLWLARRFDSLYLNVVERHLVKQGDLTPVVIASETGWTVLDLPAQRRPPPVDPPKAIATPVSVHDDPSLRVLADLRSGHRVRVEAALAALSRPDALQVAETVQLLAWDDVVPNARRLLEAAAPAHLGLLIDALLDPDTDFAVRRRVPRVLGTVPSERALSGLVYGLDDARFEVRYQCARAIDRILTRTGGVPAEPQRVLEAVQRELSVPPSIWHGHQLIDSLDQEEGEGAAPRRAQQGLEHVFTLLSAVLPRGPLRVAFNGIQSDDTGMRSLALEYLEGVLPAEIRIKLWAIMDAQLEPHHTRTTPEQALEQLRVSAERHALGRERQSGG